MYVSVEFCRSSPSAPSSNFEMRRYMLRLATRTAQRTRLLSTKSMPPAVWVTVTVPEDKREEFLKVMEVKPRAFSCSSFLHT